MNQSERLTSLLRAKQVGQNFILFFGHCLNLGTIDKIQEELKEIQKGIDELCQNNLVIH